MFSAIFRIIKYGFINFKRNAWLSAATIAVLVLALIVFSGLYLFNIFTSTVITSVQNKIDISVYFKNTTSEDDVLRIQSALKEMPEVKTVEYISKDEALEIFKEKHKDDETISSAIEQLEENPLLPSINIKAKNPEEYSIIAAYLNSDSSKELIDSVSYNQNATVIDRLGKILSIVKNGGITLTLFMSLISILIIFNTIRLAIYSNRKSIEIMKLVGGSGFFIRGPFLVESMIYGISATIISVVLIAPIVYFTSPYSNILVPELNMWEFFTSNATVLIVYELLFAMGLGLISSFFAMSRYLKR